MSDYWTERGLTKPQQIIVCAANRVGDLIICGARHCDPIMRAQAAAAGVRLTASEQGFINQFGEFLTRREAMDIVLENGQPFDAQRNSGNGRDLYSEGLY